MDLAGAPAQLRKPPFLGESERGASLPMDGSGSPIFKQTYLDWELWIGGSIWPIHFILFNDLANKTECPLD